MTASLTVSPFLCESELFHSRAASVFSSVISLPDMKLQPHPMTKILKPLIKIVASGCAL